MCVVGFFCSGLPSSWHVDSQYGSICVFQCSFCLFIFFFFLHFNVVCGTLYAYIRCMCMYPVYCFMWVVHKIGSAIKSSCKLSYYRTCTFCRLLIYHRSLLISFFAFAVFEFFFLFCFRFVLFSLFYYNRFVVFVFD